MKKAICALLVVGMASGVIGLAAPQAAADEPKTVEEKFRHHSPLPAAVVLIPLGLTAFAVDLPIYLVSRKQPVTYGLTQVELLDGYNPITDKHSDEEAEDHVLTEMESY